MFYLRSRSQAIKAGAFFLFGVLIIVATFLDEVRASFLPPTLLACGVWALSAAIFLRPSLTFDDEALYVSNWLYDVVVPWSAYRGYRSLYGLVAVTPDAEVTIAAFPGSGGIAAGQRQIVERRRAARDSFISDPWVHPKEKLQWVSARQARIALDAKAKAVGAVSGPAEKIHSDSIEASQPYEAITRRLSPVGCSLIILGLGCLIGAFLLIAG